MQHFTLLSFMNVNKLSFLLVKYVSCLCQVCQDRGIKQVSEFVLSHFINLILKVRLKYNQYSNPLKETVRFLQVSNFIPGCIYIRHQNADLIK